MDKAERNKRVILRYFKALNEADDKSTVLSRYTSDPKLMERTAFLEEAFPGHRVMVDEVTAEANRVVARARFIGRASSSGEAVEIPFAIGYQVEQDKIVSHWLISGPLALPVQGTVSK